MRDTPGGRRDAQARRAKAAWDDFFGDNDEDWLPFRDPARAGAFRDLAWAQGAPPERRLAAWGAWCGLEGGELRFDAADAKLETMLAKDVARTLRGTPYFRDGDGGDALAALLRTVAVERPDVGYVQGMNYVAAFVLLVARGDDDGASSPTDPATAAAACRVFRGAVGLVRGAGRSSNVAAPFEMRALCCEIHVARPRRRRRLVSTECPRRAAAASPATRLP